MALLERLKRKLNSMKKNWKPRIRELKYTLRQLRKTQITIFGIGLILFFIFLGAIGPAIVPYEIGLYKPSIKLLPPSRDHLFGTDRFGQDILSRCILALLIDLRIAVIVVFFAVLLGIIIGGVAGYWGGSVDEVLMRITEIFLAVPGLILAMAVGMTFNARGMDVILYSLIPVWWPAYARLMRGEVKSEKEKLYVDAARAVGLSDTKILIKHIFPNAISSALILATLDLGGVLLTTAALSFIGFGPRPGAAELGLMVFEGQSYLSSAPWYVFFPGMILFLIVMGFNLLGDGLRDVFNPRIRR
ncbi:MAG: ABC transporter permease [Candidatus Korarchaeota archaeon]|nr:ABC transporter permease [Candidatus Korarchaeota archaeon]NIU82761.1 ABC transporter permease subunit [Candidatus Thorarchaeota archaeon]NIW13255.1 ABC transporter permease subunit [Candidatus Thorarchaeota archaeon]NIW51382.1 ABC transporter permease subunit [Candidatus Korarchaeota archaeon]